MYTTDESIREYYNNVDQVGPRDRDMMLLSAAAAVAYNLAKAEKWLYVKNDLEYCFLWIMYSVENLARVEVLLHGRVTAREAIQQALELNPTFFRTVYTDLIHADKTRAVLQAALTSINCYFDNRQAELFGPVLGYLAEAGGVRTTSEINAYFAKQAQTGSLGGVYEWLADKGVIQKVPSPMRLTDKSSVALVDEAAYYYDGGSR